MAYCEVVTKIGNEFEKLDISDPPAYRECEAPPSAGGGVCCAAPGPAIISGIMDDLIEDAVCASEGDLPHRHTHPHPYPHQPQQQRPPLHADVGDVPAGVSSACDKSHGSEAAGGGEEEMTTRGVGDQLAAAQEEVVPVRDTPSSTVRHPPVEKKSRLTDLVKNSKQVLSKFILNESLKVKHDEWEEKTEKELAVVDLEEGRDVGTATTTAAASRSQYRVAAGILPDVASQRLSEDAEDAEDALRCMDEGRMETVELGGGRASTLGPGQAVGVGAAAEAAAAAKKTLTFPAGGSRGLRGRFSMMRLHGGPGGVAGASGGGSGGGVVLELRKRKWNLGTRLINYIRKRSTRSRRDSERETAKQ